jgi:tRNA threonylcarbamoyladenosine biosynthesis protein TsaB
MLILSVDCASRAGSVALTRDEVLIGSVNIESDESHSVRLFSALEFLTGQLHVSLSEIDAYAVTTGPGSFSGLRIAVASIKGFAEMHQKPTVAISTLEAIAASGVGLSPGETLVPIIDARRSELYAGVYTLAPSGLERIEQDQLFAAEAFFFKRPATHCVFLGPEVKNFAPFIDPKRTSGWSMQSTTPFLAPLMAKVAQQKISRGETFSADRLSIHYIRRSDAELMFKG